MAIIFLRGLTHLEVPLPQRIDFGHENLCMISSIIVGSIVIAVFAGTVSIYRYRLPFLSSNISQSSIDFILLDLKKPFIALSGESILGPSFSTFISAVCDFILVTMRVNLRIE